MTLARSLARSLALSLSLSLFLSLSLSIYFSLSLFLSFSLKFSFFLSLHLPKFLIIFCLSLSWQLRMSTLHRGLAFSSKGMRFESKSCNLTSNQGPGPGLECTTVSTSPSLAILFLYFFFFFAAQMAQKGVHTIEARKAAARNGQSAAKSSVHTPGLSANQCEHPFHVILWGWLEIETSLAHLGWQS